MFKWSVIFLIISIVAGLLGFTNVAGVSLDIAKILFVIFLVLFLFTVIVGGTLAHSIFNHFKR